MLTSASREELEQWRDKATYETCFQWHIQIEPPSNSSNPYSISVTFLHRVLTNRNTCVIMTLACSHSLCVRYFYFLQLPWLCSQSYSKYSVFGTGTWSEGSYSALLWLAHSDVHEKPERLGKERFVCVCLVMFTTFMDFCAPFFYGCTISILCLRFYYNEKHWSANPRWTALARYR